jgi:hypothetical protein
MDYMQIFGMIDGLLEVHQSKLHLYMFQIGRAGNFNNGPSIGRKYMDASFATHVH